MKTEEDNNNKVQIVSESQQVAKQNGGCTFNFFDPEQFETIQRMARYFAKSDIVPDIYRESDKNPLEKAIANCLVALETAYRTGATPFMVMQNIVIIYGMPSWSSKFVISMVNSCGRFEMLRFRFKNKGMLGIVEYTEYNKTWAAGTNGGKGFYKNEAKKMTFDGRNIMNIECVAWTRAKGSDEVLESAPISLRLAIQEGWYQKSGSKWQTMTEQLLMYRAASFWANVYAPELSMGMQTVDEVKDIIDVVPIEEELATDKLNKEKQAKANKIVVDTEVFKEDDPIVTATTSIKDELEATTTNDLMFS
jgi:hypothetical protein